MIDGGKTRAQSILSAMLLLTACAITHDRDGAELNKGDQYLRYGVEAFSAGQPAMAKSRFNRALGLFEKSGNLDGQIRAHINLGEQAFRTRDISGAAAHIKRAEELVLRSGKMGYQRRILLIQSSIALSGGDYENANALLNDLLGGTDKGNGDQTKDAIYIAALINRTVLSLKQEDGTFAQWVERLKRSLDTGQEIRPSVSGRLLRFEAEIHRRNGEFDKAEASFERALSAYESVPFEVEIGATLYEWAQLDIEQGKWFRASDKLRRSILIKDGDGDREGVIEGLQLLVKVESECGRPVEADALRELVLVLGKNRGPYGTRVQDMVGAPPGSN